MRKLYEAAASYILSKDADVGFGYRYKQLNNNNIQTCFIS